ncbi:DUF2480 family protein [Cryomorpha ignava]|uniref:DUF2480 family protein n=1 Tax=Cryomorpha ignava TaxID=101383 RepID=A0A7K3WTU4_9FLAO|nr:DUF2480 family protein [Cryomorpha ignava]NEN25100.1 DUF2480 family protein [Cryomorpha ignava]
MDDKPIVNKIANAGLNVLEMSRFTSDEEIQTIDIASQLWQGIALKEKDFRAYISETDWSAFDNKYVAVFCSVDAIVPNWAFMLIASSLAPHTQHIYFGKPAEYASYIVLQRIEKLDLEEFRDQRVMVKGCGDKAIDFSAFGALAARLTPVVKSLMFGEPCSTVPVYKRK